MNKIWVTESGIIHRRKPEMEATEYVEVTDQGLLERTAMRLAYENDKLRTSQQQPDAELLEALKALLAGLEKTTWSSWQTTADFQKEEEYAREVVARAEQKGGINPIDTATGNE